MNQAYYETWSNLVKNVQEPIKEIAELNIKTLKSFSYVKPEDFTAVKKPTDIVEKQIHVAVENGQKTLDYMQKYFEILEKSMLAFAQDAKKATEIKK